MKPIKGMFQVGAKVVLKKPHPWAGNKGEIVGHNRPPEFYGEGWKIRLIRDDALNKREVFVFDSKELEEV